MHRVGPGAARIKPRRSRHRLGRNRRADLVARGALLDSVTGLPGGASSGVLRSCSDPSGDGRLDLGWPFGTLPVSSVVGLAGTPIRGAIVGAGAIVEFR